MRDHKHTLDGSGSSLHIHRRYATKSLCGTASLPAGSGSPAHPLLRHLGVPDIGALPESWRARGYHQVNRDRDLKPAHDGDHSIERGRRAGHGLHAHEGRDNAREVVSDRRCRAVIRCGPAPPCAAARNNHVKERIV